MKHLRWIVLAVALPLGLAACARSQKFEQDQSYAQYPRSYYNSQGPAIKDPTTKFAQMGQPKKRVVVYDLWNDTPVPFADIGKFASDELRRGLFLSQRVLQPTDIKTKSTTETFLDGPDIRVAQLVREGRSMGVSVAVVGRIARITFRQRGDEVGLFRNKQSLAAVDVEVKIFDVAGGREILAIGRSGESTTNTLSVLENQDLSSVEFRGELVRLALRQAMAQLVPDVLRSLEKLTWEGKIAKIIGKKVYISAGRQSGLVAGDILKVLTDGEDVYDPETGAYLGKTQGQLKGTLEVVDFLGDDAAITRLHTGGHFAKGDVVRLY